MNWKIESIKRIDSLIGRPAAYIVKKIIKPRKIGFSRDLTIAPDVLSSRKLRILVIRPGGIGDAALLYPALNVLRKYFKHSMIDVLAEKRNAGIFHGCPYLDNVLLYDSRPQFALFKSLRAEYDIVIDTEQWHRLSALAAYLTRAPVRVGFATNGRSELFTHKVSYSHHHYEALSFLNLVSAITGEKYDFNKNEPFIPIDSELIERLDNSIQVLKKGSRGVVGVFSGATIKERKWEIQRYAKLAKMLSDEGVGIVLIGGNDDLHDSERILDVLEVGDFLNFVGETSLLETAAVISLVDVFVSSDTGLMHVAYGVGTPTVSLFGAGIIEKWAPIGDKNLVINKNLPCSPCTRFGYTPRCPYNVRCLNDITVGEVKESILNLNSGVRRS